MPGAKVACGKRVDGDFSYVYCFEGVRTCLETGVYGECQEGSIVARPLSAIRPSALATSSSACTGGTTANLLVCVTGKKQGEPCQTGADCGPGKKKCTGGTDSTKDCKRDGDCQVLCGRFNGKCSGGPTPNIGCNVDADCGAGGTCHLEGGGGVCGTYVGICDSTGPEDGDSCNADADCGGGQCKLDVKGNCLGGKNNGSKCLKNKHCKGVGVCSVDKSDPTLVVDPCDPNCNVYSDTPIGFDAGASFILADGGLAPKPTCGNGALAPPEQCDDGNTTNGDGCSASCMLEPGYQCPTPGSPCTPSTCGNGIVEGLEQCDDGNFRPYDGCSPRCTKEVSCPASGPCVAVCGDGIKFPSEACDDGNLTNGDGCSSTCTIEPGATCTTIVAAAPPYIDVPVIYRDFNPSTHPDFQKFNGYVPHNVPPASPYNIGYSCGVGVFQGIPAINLGADKEPVFSATKNCVKNAASFTQWYHDDATVNKVILGRSLRLFKSGTAYVFDSTNDTVTTPNINCGDGSAATCKNLGGFFPINGLGFGNYSTFGKNFHFTSEVRYPFTYAGGETLSFSGDDDVFVYVNGRKVVDLGGVHNAAPGSVTLSATTTTVPTATPVGLVVGNTYEIVVFQAERNTTGSNYLLTLQGFNQTKSQCTVPPPPSVVVRDFEGVCPPGNRVEWQLFRWKATVPTGQSIDFRAATADDPLTLPSAGSDPTTVPIGSATPANSPLAGPIVWTYDSQPVSARLAAATPSQSSKHWLRVFMSFNGLPTLYEWQQLYDCVPAE